MSISSTSKGFIRRKLPVIKPERKATLPLENLIGQLPWREHTAAWGWQMWTPCMGTGAVCTLVFGIPYKFAGQHTIAVVFLFINLLLFLVNLTIAIQRLWWHPKVFWNSFYSQNEGVYFPCANIALATVLLGAMNLGFTYTGPWIVRLCEVLYWIYIGISLFTGLIVQNTLRTQARSLEDVSPADCLEIFPLMLAGTLGSVLAPQLPPDRALVIILVAYVVQGLGFFFSILKLSAWMLHHITLERVPGKVLPSYVIALGPPGFTALGAYFAQTFDPLLTFFLLAFINLGTVALKVFPAVDFLKDKIDPLLAAQVFFAAGIWFSFFLLGWCLWVFWLHAGWSAISLFRMIVQRDGPNTVGYSMSWWSWTFPLSGCLSALGKLATLIPSKTLGVIHITGTIFVFFMWMVNVYGTGHMILSGELPAAPKEWRQIGEETKKKKEKGSTDDAER